MSSRPCANLEYFTSIAPLAFHIMQVVVVKPIAFGTAPNLGIPNGPPLPLQHLIVVNTVVLRCPRGMDSRMQLGSVASWLAILKCVSCDTVIISPYRYHTIIKGHTRQDGIGAI